MRSVAQTSLSATKGTWCMQCSKWSMPNAADVLTINKGKKALHATSLRPHPQCA